MEHSKQPSTIYDLTALASAVARYNVKNRSKESMQQLHDEHANAIKLVGKESVHKPPVPHTDDELVRTSEDFSNKILQMLNIAECQGNIGSGMASETRYAIDRYVETLRSIKPGNRWMVSRSEIDAMFGINISDDSVRKTLYKELGDLFDAEPPQNPPIALNAPVTQNEVDKLSVVMRKKLFLAPPIDPLVYTEPNPEKHYLFWTPLSNGQECAVPGNYSLGEYFRFHSPHNDTHLSHLFALRQEGVMGYMDYMDERAYFEAVAVLSEYQIRTNLEKDESGLKYELHGALEPERREAMSADDLALWMIEMRKYESRLRAARLMADYLTLEECLPFEELVEKSSKVTGLSKKDAEDEARKYYFLTGLGAVYTLGYLKLLEKGIDNPINAIERNGSTIRTWKDFHQTA